MQNERGVSGFPVIIFAILHSRRGLWVAYRRDALCGVTGLSRIKEKWKKWASDCRFAVGSVITACQGHGSEAHLRKIFMSRGESQRQGREGDKCWSEKLVYFRVCCDVMCR